MLVALEIGNNTQRLWMIAAGLGVVFLVITVLVVFLVLKSFRNRREGQRKEFTTSTPRTANASAFMAASMQGVIQQLREQEKELERLHRIERERAEQTERLSEEVTRNMPAGLLVVNAMGIISSSNPAAEQVLGIRGLAFRRYSEALGCDHLTDPAWRRKDQRRDLSAYGFDGACRAAATHATERKPGCARRAL